MYYLIDKYAPFSTGEGPPRLEKSEMATLSAERDHTVGEGPLKLDKWEMTTLSVEREHNAGEGLFFV